MPINFPINPTIGDFYSFANTTWQWSGEYWLVYSAQTGYITSVSNAGNGFPVIKSITSNALTLKSFSGTNVTITDTGDELVFSAKGIQNLIIVGKGGNVDFTSIKAAVDSITNSSESNRFVIQVGPGVYYENEIDLSTKPYVSIIGGTIETTNVVAATNSQNIFKLGFFNEISFLTLSGASTGYAGVVCTDAGVYALAHKVSMYDCDTNVSVTSSSQDTQFYGEYLDFNGEYSYGVKTVATNGYQSLANIENYYSFPSGTGATIANYAQGSGATLNLFLSSHIYSGASGSTAIELQDGAKLTASALNIDNWDYGIRVRNIGDASTFDIDGASIVNCTTYNLYVEHPNASGNFQGSSSHLKTSSASPNVYWSFLDSEDGEFDVTRKISVTFQDGSHTDLSTLLFEGSGMGLLYGGVISATTGTTISVSEGYGYLEKFPPDESIIKRIDWNLTGLTLPTNSNQYVYFNNNSILSNSGSLPDTTYNILLGRVVTNLTGVTLIDASPLNANHISNSLSIFNRNALGPVYASGSFVTQNTTPFRLNVSSGVYYFSENEFSPTGGTGITFTQYYRNGVGGWNTSATTVVNNTSFDINGSLSALTTSAFTKHTLYVVGEGVNEKYFLVLGQAQYTNLVDAEGADLPTPPTYFNDSVTPIASVYIQQGLSGITRIEDIRPVIGFKAAGVSATALHANLLGLSSDDHTQYLLVNGNRGMEGALDMGTNNITSAGTINGVTIQTHAIRHKFSGDDPVGTTTPTPNAIPYANINGLLDDWISTASTSTKGLVKLSSEPLSAPNPIAVSESDSRFLNSISGVSYSSNTLTFTNNSGGTEDIVVNNLSGLTINGNLTVTGNTSLQGLTATTFSATTYQNLPTYVSATTLSSGNVLSVTTNGSSASTYTVNAVTGGSFNNGTITLSGTGTILSQITGLTSTDTYVTGFTINNNTFTISRNQGQSDLIQILTTLTGLTINGDLRVTGSTTFTDGFTSSTLTVTGNSSLQGLTATTFSANTYQNLPTYVSATSLSALNVLSVTTNGSSVVTQTVNAVTGGSFNNGTLLFSGTGTILSGITGFGVGSTFTGGTVSGATNFTSGLTANTLSAQTINASGDISGNLFNVNFSSGSEGGQINMAKPQSGTSLSSAITLDIYENKIRFFETSSPQRGAYITLTDCAGPVGTNLLANDKSWLYAAPSTTAATETGYIITGTTTIALPTTCSLGYSFDVISATDNLFTITQSAGQQIRFGLVTTTLGSSGTLVSQNIGDAIKLICTSANTVFTVVSAIGNFTLN